MIEVYIRLYGGLSKYNSEADDSKAISLSIEENVCISDVVIRLGVPRAKVNLIFANNRQQDDHYQLQDGDRIAIFPLVAGG